MQDMRGMGVSQMEFPGGLGDLGTFIPLTAALSIVTGMDIGGILGYAGLFNITTAESYRRSAHCVMT
jgi:hypothetical protein